MALSRTPVSPEACSRLADGRDVPQADADRRYPGRRRPAPAACRCPAAPPTGAGSSGSATPWSGPVAPVLARHPRAARSPGRGRLRRGAAGAAAGPVTETLTYIAGRAAVPPLAEDMLTDDALVSVADLLRRYHRAAASFDPAGYAWPRPVPARYRTGLVSHNDVYPANVVFRDGRAVALIDFDLAGPGSAPGTSPPRRGPFVPLLDEADVTDSRARARARRGSASSSPRPGSPGPGACRSPRRWSPTTTGRTRSSPRRPPPGTPGSPTTGARSGPRPGGPAAGANGTAAPCSPPVSTPPVNIRPLTLSLVTPQVNQRPASDISPVMLRWLSVFTRM